MMMTSSSDIDSWSLRYAASCSSSELVESVNSITLDESLSLSLDAEVESGTLCLHLVFRAAFMAGVTARLMLLELELEN